MVFNAKTGYLCRKKAFLPKQTVSAETPKGQIKTERVSAKFLPKFLTERPPKYPFGRPLVHNMIKKTETPSVLQHRYLNMQLNELSAALFLYRSQVQDVVQEMEGK